MIAQSAQGSATRSGSHDHCALTTIDVNKFWDSKVIYYICNRNQNNTIMKIYFEHNGDTVQDYIKDQIREAVEADILIHNNVFLELIDEDEEDDYENDEGFVAEHKNDCSFYFVSLIVTGSWKQPLCLIAVDY